MESYILKKVIEYAVPYVLKFIFESLVENKKNGSPKEEDPQPVSRALDRV